MYGAVAVIMIYLFPLIPLYTSVMDFDFDMDTMWTWTECGCDFYSYECQVGMKVQT
jgi:hypothetical protein